MGRSISRKLSEWASIDHSNLLQALKHDWLIYQIYLKIHEQEESHDAGILTRIDRLDRQAKEKVPNVNETPSSMRHQRRIFATQLVAGWSEQL